MPIFIISHVRFLGIPISDIKVSFLFQQCFLCKGISIPDLLPSQFDYAFLGMARLLRIDRHILPWLHGVTRSVQFSLSSLLLVICLFLISTAVIPVTDEEAVLDSSFFVDSGASYGPYDEGTVYHPKTLGSSLLQGEVSVDGGGVFLTVNGHYTEELKNIYITQHYTFTVMNAHEQYTFVFNNTGGSTQVSIHLTVAEVWTRPLAIATPLSVAITIGCGATIILVFLVIVVRRLKPRFSDLL